MQIPLQIQHKCNFFYKNQGSNPRETLRRMTFTYIRQSLKMSSALLGLACLFVFLPGRILSQSAEIITLSWKSPLLTEAGTYRLGFEGAHFGTATAELPVFFKRLDNSYLDMDVVPIETALLSPEESRCIQTDLPNDFRIQTEEAIERKQPVTVLNLIPLRRNPSTGRAEKLISFQINYRTRTSSSVQKAAGIATFNQQSVLSSGDWFKFGVTSDGVYKVTAYMLLNAGMNPAQLSLSGIRVFGNGGGMVPELNGAPRKDDLQECPIAVVDENQDGLFSGNDYLLFYGQSPDQWFYNANEKKYNHVKHIYSDTTYYFISGNASGVPARITSVNSLPSSSGDPVITTFTDFTFYENEERNFIKSGRGWYGEVFDVILNKKFNFTLPNLVPGPVKLKSSVVGRTVSGPAVTSQFNVSYNGNTVLNHIISNVGTSYTADFGRSSVLNTTFNATSSDITLDYTFLPYNATATGYMDYIELNLTRSLRFSGNELTFRYRDTTGLGGNIQYTISNTTSGLTLWNISDPNNVTAQAYNISGGIIDFTSNITAGGEQKYILFNNTAARTPVFSGKVENQNLHGLSQAAYIIIAHPDFLAEAERLAEFHKTHDNLSTVVVSLPQIFNEFSSGAQDASAIRDFIRMFYERSTSAADAPRYVLLFGDGSYDLKNHVGSNTNFITTYQSYESLSILSSYTCDDFFGLLDPAEGDFSGTELMDVGVGRFPVKTEEEAREMVDKVITYSTIGTINDQSYCQGSNSTRLGDWRNVLCFISDDQDDNLHQRQSERISKLVQQNYPVYNVDKILSDAYQQVSTPGGQRYPDVNDAITQRVEKGALILNYTGHGGELGWAAESILNNDMINSWHNANNMPAFITATCEFSRYDDPQRTSAGEFVLLNGQGGGICLFTTVRIAFAFDNELINSDMMVHMFSPLSGEMPRVGDIMRLSKRDNPGNRNVTLLGDPALRLAYPRYRINTTAIQETGSGQSIDTLSALSKVTVKGKVIDDAGNIMTSFNGVVYPTIYDKETKIYNIVNDSTGDDVSIPDSFNLRKNILYKGKASVVNGEFSCSFIVPKDISFQYGTGRLSYYAHNGSEDANGYDQNLYIGGISTNAINDQQGPQIRLYMNDENFVTGSMTNSTPNIFAILFDSSGINTVGNGIGHDVTAIVDNNPKQLFVLNDYYESDLDSYQKGRVRYRLDALSDGPHTLTFKAWDINNNSSEATTDFVVSSSAGLALQHVLNYPNPFTTKTTFMFEHNKPCTGMAIQVQIFTVTGKLVKTIDAYQVCEGFRNTPLDWDGKDDFGDQLAKGVYIYRLRIRTAEGETAQKTERLVLIR